MKFHLQQHNLHFPAPCASFLHSTIDKLQPGTNLMLDKFFNFQFSIQLLLQCLIPVVRRFPTRFEEPKREKLAQADETSFQYNTLIMLANVILQESNVLFSLTLICYLTEVWKRKNFEEKTLHKCESKLESAKMELLEHLFHTETHSVI